LRPGWYLVDRCHPVHVCHRLWSTFSEEGCSLENSLVRSNPRWGICTMCIHDNQDKFPSHQEVSLNVHELVQQILTPNPQECSSLHNIVNHTFFIYSTVPGSISISAQDTPRFPSHLGSHLANERCLPPHNGHTRTGLLQKLHPLDTSTTQCLLQLIIY